MSDLYCRLSDLNLRRLLRLPLGTSASCLLAIQQLFLQLLLELLPFKGKLLLLSHLVFLLLLLIQFSFLFVLGLLHP